MKLGYRIMKCTGIVLAVIVVLPVFTVSIAILYWNVRLPPDFTFDPMLDTETWVAVPASNNKSIQHNSNTDMIYYQNNFYLIHAQTKWHLQDKHGALVIQRSTDARQWEEVARITVPNTDVRDPKFAIIHGQLFLYFLPNWRFDPGPNTTYWTVSGDGTTWATPVELTSITVKYHYDNGTTVDHTSGNWNLWRPKTFDNVSWYVIAGGRKIDKQMTVLLNSSDGINWEEVSEVYSLYGNGEPELEFTPSHGIIATLRCGSLGVPGYEFGNPTGNTIIASSEFPYVNWSYSHSFITRLDGSTSFSLDGRIFAVGRNQIGPAVDTGNHLSKKRTAFYEVTREKLIFLFDLPSQGDTAYTGVVLKDGQIYASYYTNPMDDNIGDFPWIIGICFQPKSEIRIARVSQAGLIAYADSLQT